MNRYVDKGRRPCREYAAPCDGRGRSLAWAGECPGAPTEAPPSRLARIRSATRPGPHADLQHQANVFELRLDMAHLISELDPCLHSGLEVGALGHPGGLVEWIEWLHVVMIRAPHTRVNPAFARVQCYAGRTECGTGPQMRSGNRYPEPAVTADANQLRVRHGGGQRYTMCWHHPQSGTIARPIPRKFVGPNQRHTPPGLTEQWGSRFPNNLDQPK